MMCLLRAYENGRLSDWQTYQSTVIWLRIINRQIAHIQTVGVTVAGKVYMPRQSLDKQRTKFERLPFQDSMYLVHKLGLGLVTQSWYFSGCICYSNKSKRDPFVFLSTSGKPKPANWIYENMNVTVLQRMISDELVVGSFCPRIVLKRCP